MRCKGINKKETRNRSKTIYCNAELHPHQIYCHVCGEPTDALKTGLSAANNFKDIWKYYKSNYSNTLGLGLFLTLLIFIPLAFVVFYFWNNYWLTNLILLFIIPLAFIPFGQGENLTIKGFLKSLFKYYPSFWLFTLIAELYFFILKVICTGYLLNIMVDPVLHIVRLIMILYGITCVIPVPLLITEKKLNPFKAIILSIKAGRETRWQQFYVALQVAFINVIGAACLFAGLLFTLPLSYRIIRSYYLKMLEYELFISYNPTLEIPQNLKKVK